MAGVHPASSFPSNRSLSSQIDRIGKGAGRRHRKPVKISPRPHTPAAEMVAAVRAAPTKWKYDVVSIGHPGSVVQGIPSWTRIILTPDGLGLTSARRWVGRSRSPTMRRCKRWAAIRAAVCLFLIVNHVLELMKVAHLPYKKKYSYQDYIGAAPLKQHGKRNGAIGCTRPFSCSRLQCRLTRGTAVRLPSLRILPVRTKALRARPAL